MSAEKSSEVPKLLVANKLGRSAVGWKCSANGCTWRVGPPHDSGSAEIAFKAHVKERHSDGDENLMLDKR